MGKSLLYAANTVSQATTANGSTLNFGTTVRRRGCSAELSGGNVITKGIGYYGVSVNAVFIATAAGNEVIKVFKDGVEIPGATVSFTTAESTTYAVSIPCVVRNTCCESPITVVASGVAGAVTNASIVVENL